MDWGVVGTGETSRRMWIGRCWTILAGGCAMGGRAGLRSTCGRMGCRWVICGCAWSRPQPGKAPGGRARGSRGSTGSRVPADVLIANAGLDLVDVPAILPGMSWLLVPGGVDWFTMNYDGESIFVPVPPTIPGYGRRTTATWTSASATVDRPEMADGLPPVRPSAGRGDPRRRGVVGLVRDACRMELPVARLTPAQTAARSRTRCGIARIGWDRRTWPRLAMRGRQRPAGASWSTSPTSSIRGPLTRLLPADRCGAAARSRLRRSRVTPPAPGRWSGRRRMVSVRCRAGGPAWRS